MDVAGYIRVSTEQQREEGSHENQKEKLRQWADRNDHDLEIFEDIAISGQSDERPAYHELLDRCQEFDAVAVRELSRFGRSLRQVLQDIEHLDDHGTKFISITEDFNTDSAMGKAMMQMIGVFNEFWANLSRERALETVERRKEQGKPVGRPRKLDDSQIGQVREWHEMGLGYSAIATLVEDTYGEEIHRSTIRRYVTSDS